MDEPVAEERSRRDGHRDDRKSDRRDHKSDQKSEHKHKSDKDRKRSRRSRSREDKERRKSSRRSEDRGKSSRRSASPAPRRRERKSGFDQPPAGGVIPGFAPLPGIDNSGPPTAIGTGFNTGFSANPLMGLMPGMQPPSQQATRHARRVYVGGLPPTANEQNIATFFSNALAAIGGTTAGPGPSVVNVYINYEKKFAFVEFRTVEETSNAMALDGIMFEGVSVRVRRPNDYNPAAAASLGPSVPSGNLNLSAIGLQPGGMQGALVDAAERVFVGGLPYYLSEEQCHELLGSFGAIKSFDLVKDRETGNSKGSTLPRYGFVVYADSSVTDIACAGLNGMRMGERTLTVRRATELPGGAGPVPGLPGAPPGPPDGQMAVPADATRILSLLEAVTPQELADNDEYADILEDMREECGKYGTVAAVVIPRPAPEGGVNPPGVGKVLVEFADVPSAVKAHRVLHGRRFAGRTVTATYLSEELYATGQFD